MQQEEKKIPNFVSWRNAGILQPIRDQRPETSSLLTIGSKISTTLSVQHVLETVYLIKEREKKRGNNAEKNTHFSGTYSNRVWDAILKYGITTEELYPYKGGIITKGISLEKLQFRKLYRIQGYGLVKPDAYDATALMRRVAKQPAIVAVDASFWPQKGWKSVETGRQRVSADTNHEVLVVGYANDKIPPGLWSLVTDWLKDSSIPPTNKV
ncbi:papain family cysteine protease [Medicago truncatula]|uniref:Papain family cysteine protease n=1 Tax=Medicago truncatula TaxID=3880 RepID=G7KCT2_MEDTR|nr:papain family cysteine protease [Medicago truncatula]